MEKSFEPRPIESKWYPHWETSGAFRPRGHGEPYCILLPPPNVTGTLHMGHAFQQTMMDILIRQHRMRGFDTLWQVGTDHAGIATQKIVENQLAAEGKTRQDLGREGFVARVWQWKETSGSTITHQMRRLGLAADWSRERFTMDPGLSAAVRKVFVEWYRAGLIYRGKRLVNWDPELKTAVSDLEVDNEERDGFLWSIRYPVADGEESLVVATTRPETMLGDVAVAVHPEDERYAHLIGKMLKLPLTDRQIPVIADAYVDREFGTGAVKITPAHDFNDYAIGQRHGLAPIGIFTLDAHLNDDVPPAYRGLERYEARKRILADLEAAGLLVATQPHKLKVPVSQRSGAVVEPMLTDQWFVDLTRDVQPDGRPGGRQAITRPALDAVREGHIRFVPENWAATYTQWLENIQDWCISRQLWWGHQIPAWYDEAGQLYVGEDEADARAWAAAHGAPAPVGALRQDEDVLDTWFSSALWPFSTMGWPSEGPVTNERGEIVADWRQDQRFLPSAVLVTGFDIIFFWVARMVMSSLYFAGRRGDGSYEPRFARAADRIPFREVYINAIVRDAEGQKMSKSKGNTLDPLDLIDGIELEALVEKSTRSLLIPQVREKVEKRIRRDYPEGIKPIGADALRFTFTALAGHSRTINFDLKRAEGYKAFCNKLWNAARFVLLNLPEGRIAPPADAPLTDAERWILTRLKYTLAAVDRHLAEYRFDLLAQALYEFVWNAYCDWCLELAKPALADRETAAAASTRHTLLVVLETVLRALHPVIPFITEEIWQAVAPRLGIDPTPGILGQSWPDAAALTEDAAASARIEWLQAVLTGIRRIRAEMNIAPNRTLPLLLVGGDAHDHERIAAFAAEITFLGRTEPPRWLAAGTPEPAAATAVVGTLKVLIPLAGLIDLDAERARLAKEIARLESELRKSESKLAKPEFVAHAPPAVVAQERERVVAWTTRLAALREQADKLANA
ncbi:valine--tRNA ligase [Aerosticca soli]|uniref:Valine--tRNA ligase n=1 Tax=Aerosticca soli TaxID=2010829 RepID=A0A2Z6E479_9GAMM|nr:valine--tRNA ligase [Aerosticca soli]BBD79722.1 valyl-tRNA synthetase [Aerosticca soli]